MSGRRMRELSVVLGLVLMVMLGAIAVVWATQGGLRTGDPATTAARRTPTPTILGASPTQATDAPATATLQPTEQPTDAASPTGAAVTPSATPTESPAGSPIESPSESPSLSPPATPVESPVAPDREIEFLGMGLDTTSGSADEPSTERFFTITAEGPGRIEASIADVTFGRVRICMWQGTPQQEPAQQCETLRRGAVSVDVPAGDPQTWTITLIGSQAGASPSADLRLRWPTNDARVQIQGFRFQGEAIENYNGFTAEVDSTADGQLVVSAAFDDDGFGGSYPWLLTIEEVGGGPSQTFVDEGNSSSMQSGTPVSGERDYRVTLSNRESVSEQRVLLSGELDWP